ncbi:TPA: hypothetical protein ACQJJO_003054 [Aeromonas veronii]
MAVVVAALSAEVAAVVLAAALAMPVAELLVVVVGMAEVAADWVIHHPPQELPAQAA